MDGWDVTGGWIVACNMIGWKRYSGWMVGWKRYSGWMAHERNG